MRSCLAQSLVYVICVLKQDLGMASGQRHVHVTMITSGVKGRAAAEGAGSSRQRTGHWGCSHRCKSCECVCLCVHTCKCVCLHGAVHMNMHAEKQYTQSARKCVPCRAQGKRHAMLGRGHACNVGMLAPHQHAISIPSSTTCSSSLASSTTWPCSLVSSTTSRAAWQAQS